MSILSRIFLLYRRAAPVIVMVGLLTMAGLATRAFLEGTSTHGIGVRTDSVAYLWGAENLAKGLGLGRLNGLGELKPMTHWPPFYPLLLTLFELAGMPALAGARFLGAALVGLILLLAGLTVWRVTRSLWFALGTCALLGLAPSLWVTSLDAMTEPLYVVLGLAGTLLLDAYLNGHRSTRDPRRAVNRRRLAFVLSALCMALALLTRYAGAALIAAAGLVLLLDRSRTGLERIKQAGVYGVLCAVPMLLWMLRNQLVAGSTTNRVLEIIPIAASDWDLLWQTMGGWVFPLQTAFAIGTGKLALVAVGVGLFLALNLAGRAADRFKAAQPALTPQESSAGQPQPQEHVQPASSLPLFYLIYALVYPLFVVFSRLVFDRLITIFEERIAFPWYLTLLLLLVFAAWGVLWLLQRSVSTRLFLAAGAALVAMYLILAWSFGVQYRAEMGRVLDSTWHSGRGLNSPQALEDEFSLRAREVDSNRVIYTDNIEILYFVSGQHAFQVNSSDESALQGIREMASRRPLAFIFFYDQAVPNMVKREFPQVKLLYQQGGSVILSLDTP